MNNQFGSAFGEFLVAIVFVALVFVMVRPQSQGPGLVTSITNGIASIINSATGGGTWN